MDIKCPHGKIVEIQNVLQVFIYLHEDGKGCPLMNAFNTTSDSVLKQYVLLHGFDNSPEVRAALATRGLPQKEMFKYLSGLQGEVFKQQLTHLLEIYLSLFGSHVYIKELISHFGPVMIANIRTLTGEDFTKFTPNAKKYAPCYDLSQLAIEAAKAKQQTTERIRHDAANRYSTRRQ